MGATTRHPRARDEDRPASSRAPDPARKAFDRRFAGIVRELATTAEMLSLTADHMSHEAEVVAEVRATRLRSRAQSERSEARRLWALADDLEA